MNKVILAKNIIIFSICANFVILCFYIVSDRKFIMLYFQSVFSFNDCTLFSFFIGPDY